jgi:hypothetical protein
MQKQDLNKLQLRKLRALKRGPDKKETTENTNNKKIKTADENNKE